MDPFAKARKSSAAVSAYNSKEHVAAGAEPESKGSGQTLNQPPNLHATKSGLDQVPRIMLTTHQLGLGAGLFVIFLSLGAFILSLLEIIPQATATSIWWIPLIGSIGILASLYFTHSYQHISSLSLWYWVLVTGTALAGMLVAEFLLATAATQNQVSLLVGSFVAVAIVFAHSLIFSADLVLIWFFLSGIFFNASFSMVLSGSFMHMEVLWSMAIVVILAAMAGLWKVRQQLGSSQTTEF
ncbi:hypothetical protein TI04_11395, partial [Achromatium sp. WMS2]